MSKLEASLQALIRRFADDYIALVRRAPLHEVARLLASAPPPRAGGVEAWAERYRLTAAEAAVLQAAAMGKPQREIARGRGVASSTVKRQATGVLRKTGDRSLLAATARLLREQL